MEKYQRQAIKINKINIPILLGLKGGGKAFRPRKKNKKMKPYTKRTKAEIILSAPLLVLPGGLEEGETIYEKEDRRGATPSIL